MGMDVQHRQLSTFKVICFNQEIALAHGAFIYHPPDHLSAHASMSPKTLHSDEYNSNAIYR